MTRDEAEGLGWNHIVEPLMFPVKETGINLRGDKWEYLEQNKP